MKLVVTEQGIPQLVESLEATGGRMENLVPALEAITLVMLRSAQVTFEAQGRPEPWDRLTKKTARRKGSSLILEETGYLRQSLTPSGNSYSLKNLTATSATIGTNRPGASAHEEGDPERNLPQRKFLVHQPEDIADYRQILIDHIVHGFGEEAGRAAA
jgi:phage gpG-like protein